MAVVEDFDFRTSRGCLESQHFLENSTGAQENDNKKHAFYSVRLPKPMETAAVIHELM